MTRAQTTRPEEGYALAVRAAGEGIWDWDLLNDTIRLSSRWHAILGRASGAEAVDQRSSVWFDLVHPADLRRLEAAIADHLTGRTPRLDSEHRLRHADGSWRWAVARGLAARGDDGRPIRMAGSLSDVSDRRMAQLRVHHDARHDPLIGLPNRRLLIDRVALALLHRPRNCAVMVLDLDRFELVNDSLGHDAGDRLLVAFAARVAAAIRPGDTLARLGADEFAVLVEDIAGLDDVAAVVDAVHTALDEPLDVDGRQLFATAGIGIALGERGITPSELIGNADIAMRSAKRRGRSRSTVFDAGMRRRAADRLARETELRRLVADAQLAIHYQPIVSLRTGAICGLEALARWPQGPGAVAPAEFIPIAEDTGMIGALGRQVLQEALRALAGWRRDGLIGDDVCMSVNLSARQLDDPALADHVRAAIAAAALPAGALKLEITESTLIADVERSQRVFAEVCAQGVALHLDDFGTGYSSLAALHRFPVDALKIDRSFVSALAEPGDTAGVIVRSTVAMAHSLGLPVIAEGIEHPAQLERLRALGCDCGQGHLFSPALDAEDMRALLAQRSRRDELIAA
jgi:diguanylate cyclase (GGDEF)-like protein/PAS domain S-box-containing protein